jgi:hypothetical protein
MHSLPFQTRTKETLCCLLESLSPFLLLSGPDLAQGLKHWKELLDAKVPIDEMLQLKVPHPYPTSRLRLRLTLALARSCMVSIDQLRMVLPLRWKEEITLMMPQQRILTPSNISNCKLGGLVAQCPLLTPNGLLSSHSILCRQAGNMSWLSPGDSGCAKIKQASKQASKGGKARQEGGAGGRGDWTRACRRHNTFPSY